MYPNINLDHFRIVTCIYSLLTPVMSNYCYLKVNIPGQEISVLWDELLTFRYRELAVFNVVKHIPRKGHDVEMASY